MQKTEKIDVHEWRDFGAELSATFAFIRQNLGGLLRSILFIPGPVLLIVGLLLSFLFRDYFSLTHELDSGPFVDDSILENRLISLSLQYLFSFIAYSLVSITIFEYVYLYAASKDGNVPLSAVWTRIKADFWKLMLAKIIMLPMLVISTLCLAIPGLLVYALLGSVEMAIIQEKASPFDGISKSFNLMGKYFLTTLGLVVVLFLIQWLLGFLLQLPPAVIDTLKELTIVEIDENSGWEIVTGLLRGFSQLVSYVLITIVTVGLGLHYYVCMEDRDSRRLRARVRMIGQPEPEYNIFAEDEAY